MFTPFHGHASGLQEQLVIPLLGFGETIQGEDPELVARIMLDAVIQQFKQS